MAKSFEELRRLATQIRDEKGVARNTAARLGQAMLDNIDKLQQEYPPKTELDKTNESVTTLESKVDSNKTQTDTKLSELSNELTGMEGYRIKTFQCEDRYSADWNRIEVNLKKGDFFYAKVIGDNITSATLWAYKTEHVEDYAFVVDGLLPNSGFIRFKLRDDAKYIGVTVNSSTLTDVIFSLSKDGVFFSNNEIPSLWGYLNKLSTSLISEDTKEVAVTAPYVSADTNRIVVNLHRGDRFIVSLEGNEILRGTIWGYFNDSYGEKDEIKLGTIHPGESLSFKCENDIKHIGVTLTPNEGVVETKSFFTISKEPGIPFLNILIKQIADDIAYLSDITYVLKLKGVESNSFDYYSSYYHSADNDRLKCKRRIIKGEPFYARITSSRVPSGTLWGYKDEDVSANIYAAGEINKVFKRFIALNDTTLIGVTVHEMEGEQFNDKITIQLATKGTSVFQELEADFFEYSDYGEMGINFPHELDIITKQIVNDRAGASERFHFIQIGDNHGANYEDLAEFLDKCPAHFAVNIGDLVQDKYTDNDFEEPPYLNAVKSALVSRKPFYLTIGNHDCVMSPSLQARFDRFIRPMNVHNGMPGNTKTYYKVDYPSHHIKCIFLDANDGFDDCRPFGMAYGKFGGASMMSDEQIKWLVNELKDAATNNLHVCIFNHVALDYISEPVRGWYDYQAETCVTQRFLPELIDTWTKGGSLSFDHNGHHYDVTFEKAGVFVSWFTGHTHYDCCGWHKDFPNQFCVTVQRPLAYGYAYDSTVVNANYNRIANYVTVDTATKHLSVMRLGEDRTIYGEKRLPFSVVYDKTAK